MRRCLTIFILLVFGLNAQNLPGGTVNGKAIPEQVFRRPESVCGNLMQYIHDQARDEVLRDLNIKVTKEDLASARASGDYDPEATAKRMRDNASLVIGALTTVDKGQDPQQVYQNVLQPKGIDPLAWDSYRKLWKTSKGRANLEAQAIVTPAALTPQLDAIVQRSALYDKLDRTVDGQLAAQDPQFRIALEHWNASERVTNGHVHHEIRQAEKDYLDARRKEYWQTQESKLHVVLNDPAVAAKCGVGGATK